MVDSFFVFHTRRKKEGEAEVVGNSGGRSAGQQKRQTIGTNCARQHLSELGNKVNKHAANRKARLPIVLTGRGGQYLRPAPSVHALPPWRAPSQPASPSNQAHLEALTASGAIHTPLNDLNTHMKGAKKEVTTGIDVRINLDIMALCLSPPK